MAAQALPPPMMGGMASPGMDPGGGMPSPAPPQANPEATQLLNLVWNIVSSARLLAAKIPGAADTARQINDLAQEIQRKIVQAGPAPEPMAPPM
jgi:hypothetical protein